jgi:hypothetical protein
LGLAIIFECFHMLPLCFLRGPSGECIVLDLKLVSVARSQGLFEANGVVSDFLEFNLKLGGYASFTSKVSEVWGNGVGSSSSELGGE